MKFRLNYLPDVNEIQKRKKKRQVLLVLFIILFVLIAAVIYQFLLNKPKPVTYSETYSICGFSRLDIDKVISDNATDKPSEIKDYVYYGESLKFFSEPYNLFEKDSLTGVTYQIKNLCNNDVYSYLSSDFIDQGIPVNTLVEGFYQVNLQNNLELNRLVSDHVINDTFITVTRNGQRLKVTLMADSSLFKHAIENRNLLQDHQVYLLVEKVEVEPEIVDIMLDPAYNNSEFGPLDMGEMNGLIAADKTYEVALAVKSRLESMGYVVGITRPNDELTVNTYGDKGRVFAGMNVQAKYMIEINFNETDDIDGVGVFGSSFVSKNMQDNIVAQLKLQGLPLMLDRGNFWVKTYPDNNLDYHNLIRESGGYALGAGLFSEKSASQNSFASENRHGIHTISIEMMSLLNPQVANNFEWQKTMLIEGISQGINNYIQLK